MWLQGLIVNSPLTFGKEQKRGSATDLDPPPEHDGRVEVFLKEQFTWVMHLCQRGSRFKSSVRESGAVGGCTYLRQWGVIPTQFNIHLTPIKVLHKLDTFHSPIRR